MRFSGGSYYLNRVEFAAEVGLGYGFPLLPIFTQVVAVAVHIHSVVLTKSEQRQPRQLEAKAVKALFSFKKCHPKNVTSNLATRA